MSAVVVRPPCLQVTKLLGIGDAELARAFGVTGMVVSFWARGERRIPRVRRCALLIALRSLEGTWGLAEAPRPDGIYARRARLLDEIISQLLVMDAEELGQLDDQELDQAEAMARQLLAHFEQTTERRPAA